MGPDEISFTPASETQPTEQQLADLAFAWRCVKHVKSNAITVAKERRLLGMGSGQPNRVKSVQIALEKAAEDVEVGSECTDKSLGCCLLMFWQHTTFAPDFALSVAQQRVYITE